MPEYQPLAGKVFMVTGASRGIGAAAALGLASEGATVIGPHRDPGKNSRAAAVVAQVKSIGGSMIAPVADITNKWEREALLEEIKTKFGPLDGIVFNHAGGMERNSDPNYPTLVNAISKVDLLNAAISSGLLKSEAVTIDIPSLWSQFAYTGIEQLPEYGPVAYSKKLGQRYLTQMIRGFNTSNPERHIKFGSVCGHAIEDTTTMKLLRRSHPQLIEALAATVEGGKLPTIADMAKSIVRMAHGTFADEAVVFVGVPQLSKEETAQQLDMYDDTTRYVNRAIFFDQKRAFAYLRVKPQHTVIHPAQARLINNQVTMEQEDTDGHFTTQKGVSVVPLHKLFALAAQSASNRLLRAVQGPVESLIPVLPGDHLTFVQYDQEVKIRIGGVDGILVDRFNGLSFNSHNRNDASNYMTEDRLIEAAAQMLGLAALRGRDNTQKILPLFTKIRGPIEFIRDVAEGELLEGEIVLESFPDPKTVGGDVTFRVDDIVVAKIPGIEAIIAPEKTLPRLIAIARRRGGLSN